MATNNPVEEKAMAAITKKIRRSRFVHAVAATALALAMVPAGASAATTWFGSSLNHEPANAGSSCTDNGLMDAICTHVGSDYPGTSGRVHAPVSGTITAIRVRAEAPMTLRLVVVQARNVSSDFSSGQAKALAQSRLISAQGPSQDDLDNGIYPVETFHVHLRVRQGNEIGIDTSSNQAEYCADGTPGQLLFDPALSPGQPFESSSAVDECLMLVQAVITH
jgi:hypothetical protein